jgi:hypothetical protein
MELEKRFEDYFAKVPARRVGAGGDRPRGRHGARVTARFALALLALGSACATTAPPPAPPPAPSSSPAARSALAGTWILVAADDLHPDGERTPAYGRAPQGLLMIDDDGRYSLQIFRADRPAFAAGVKTRGTPAEYEAAALGMSSHIGRCAIDPASNTLDFHIEAASYPNWNGTAQKRRFTLIGDELSYQVPATAAGTAAVPISVWRRIRPR